MRQAINRQIRNLIDEAETDEESEEDEYVGEETEEYDNDECKVDYVMAERRWENAKIVTKIPSKNNSITGMEGHEDLKVAKKVTCVYFKKSDKKSKDLPDTDCRQ